MKGFSLIELLVVLALLAVVSLVSIGAYGRAAERARVKLGKACVAQLSLAMVRDGALVMPALSCVGELEGYFTFAASRDSDTGLLTVSATPLPSLALQPCARMSLRETGDWEFPGDAAGECR